MHVIAHGITDVGRVRKGNEDALLVDEAAGLFTVCDGVGGHKGGEVASAMAIDYMAQLGQRLGSPASLAHELGEDAAVNRVLTLVERTLTDASEAVFSRGERDRALSGMSTTVVGMAIIGTRAAVFHSGDSRLYMLRSETLYQLTEDHSLAHAMWRRGILKEEDLKTFRHRNVIVRCLGREPTIELDTSVVELLPGDVFLACSDGLSDMIDADDIANVLAAQPPEIAAEELVRLANEAGGKDNITALVVHIEGEVPTASRRMSTERRALSLNHFTLFCDLTFQESVRVLRIVKEMHPDVGDLVIREGEAGSTIYLIVEGRIGVSRDGIPLTELSAGQHFGELSWIRDEPRTASAVVLEPSTLLVLERDDLLKLMSSDPVLATKVLWRLLQALGGRVKSLSDTLASTVGHTVDDSTCRFD
jgi:serine/threonine protein phosphatase PrpC